MLRIRGAILPLPQYIFMARCLVKHREKFYITQKTTTLIFIALNISNFGCLSNTVAGNSPFIFV
jgi:hypothetical protein